MASLRARRKAFVPFTPENRDAALPYVSSIVASGLTNLSGALDVPVPLFVASSNSRANISILADGQVTTEITNTTAMFAHRNSLIAQTKTGVLPFRFGIGADVPDAEVAFEPPVVSRAHPGLLPGLYKGPQAWGDASWA